MGDFPEADPETKIQVQVVHLGNESRRQLQECGQGRQARKAGNGGCTVKPATTLATGT